MDNCSAAHDELYSLTRTELRKRVQQLERDKRRLAGLAWRRDQQLRLVLGISAREKMSQHVWLPCSSVRPALAVTGGA
jgi:hypothetical protein